MARLRKHDDALSSMRDLWGSIKSAKFRFDKVRGDTVTLSGIFFDPQPAIYRKAEANQP